MGNFINLQNPNAGRGLGFSDSRISAPSYPNPLSDSHYSTHGVGGKLTGVRNNRLSNASSRAHISHTLAA
jgi:hypothetical protein